MILSYYLQYNTVVFSFNYLDYLEITNDITLILSDILPKVSDFFYVFHR